jgi:hypothetical protein
MVDGDVDDFSVVNNVFDDIFDIQKIKYPGGYFYYFYIILIIDLIFS